jgi:hypothetical protein
LNLIHTKNQNETWCQGTFYTNSTGVFLSHLAQIMQGCYGIAQIEPATDAYEVQKPTTQCCLGYF